ncbi:MAG TPA: hypothetical protein VH277_14275 [Gemmatimonadaceae bacterium]|jgi:hypothetical protein|nr:hypothetical protein [Gemmatimonadaceae bacterium]
MTAEKIFGTFTGNGSAPALDGDAPLGELSLSFVPLALVTEWVRCGETADFIARFFAHDYDERELAGTVLSTVVNELVENTVKFSSDKAVPAQLTVREYPDSLMIMTSNVVTPAQGDAFGQAIATLVSGDPEALFARQIANPPETGSPGIGLIMLRKDYGATIGARLRHPNANGAAVVDVEVTIAGREVGQS